MTRSTKPEQPTRGLIRDTFIGQAALTGERSRRSDIPVSNTNQQNQ